MTAHVTAGEARDAGGEPVRRVVPRKAFHVATIGLLALLAALLPRLAALRVLAGLLLALFLGFLVVSYRPRAERKEFAEATMRRDKLFPMQGTILALVGALLALFAYPSVHAAAGLAVLALGDSVSTLYALRYGRVRVPWVDRSADGWLVGVLAGAAAASLLVPWLAALAASAVGQLADLLPLRRPPVWLDDNLVTPLVAGGVLLLLL